MFQLDWMLQHKEPSVRVSTKTTSHITMEDVRSIVEEMGLNLVHVGDPKNFHDMIGLKGKDASVVYVLENGDRLKANPDSNPDSGRHGYCDALLSHKGKLFKIRWNDFSRAVLRKQLCSDDNDRECLVCFEEFKVWEASRCPQCNATICAVCVMKLTLTEQIIQRIRVYEFEELETADDDVMRAGYRCPSCRNELMIYIEKIYVRVMDRLGEFPQTQRNALLFLKDNDPKFAVRLSGWKRENKRCEEMIEAGKAKARLEKSKRLEQGCNVKLHGLKKKEWNGKKAVIIGKKQIKNGVTRWPIQLKGKRKSKALLKECNMKKK